MSHKVIKFINLYMGGGLLHTAKSLKHTKVSTRVEFFRNIFKMENIYPK
jgi:hypothetical protein